MSWWGKVMGGAFGLMLGGPLGAVLGAALGHQFDEHVGGADDAPLRARLAFFTATFSIMGRIAKVDGRVSESEIAFARSVMDQMSLTEHQRRVAIGLFNEGKDDDFPLDAALDQLASEVSQNSGLLLTFMELQIEAAYADGSLDPAAKRLLRHIGEQLGFTSEQFEHLTASASRSCGNGERYWRQFDISADLRDSLSDAYRMLDVPPEVTDKEVRSAYRRLMNQHHPDKLASKGVSEEMIRSATERTQAIKSAYEAIKFARGMK